VAERFTLSINTVHYYNTQLKTAHSIIKLQNGVHVFWLAEQSPALTCLGCPSDSSYESKLVWLTESSELVWLTKVPVILAKVECYLFSFFRILWMVPIYATDSVCISSWPFTLKMFYLAYCM